MIKILIISILFGMVRSSQVQSPPFLMDASIPLTTCPVPIPLEKMKKCQICEEQDMGTDSVDTECMAIACADELFRLADMMYDQEDYVKAIEYYLKSLEIKKKVHGDAPLPDISTSYNNLGTTYYRQGHYDKAIEFHLKSLEIKKKVHGDAPHSDIAISYTHLGDAYYKQGLYDKAIEYLVEKLDIRLNILERSDDARTISYCGIWISNHWMKLLNNYLKMVEGIYRTLFPNLGRVLVE